MDRKAIIFDLDNTIYPVPSIGDKLFASLFQLIEEMHPQKEDMKAIRHEIMRRPFQAVARDFNFTGELTRKGIEHLSDLRYEGNIHYFDDYPEILKIDVDRFLVTTGFKKMQDSKIEGMDIRRDFKEIHIVDPTRTSQTKKDIFKDILERYNYSIDEVMVVGDDPMSEIKAARELGIDSVLYDRENIHEDGIATYRIRNFRELANL